MKVKRKEVAIVRGAWAIARVSFSEGKRESFAIGKPRLPQSCGPVRKNDNSEVPLLGPNNGPKPPQKTSVAQCMGCFGCVGCMGCMCYMGCMAGTFCTRSHMQGCIRCMGCMESCTDFLGCVGCMCCTVRYLGLRGASGPILRPRIGDRARFHLLRTRACSVWYDLVIWFVAAALT
jgi:hypothetical protein